MTEKISALPIHALRARQTEAFEDAALSPPGSEVRRHVLENMIEQAKVIPDSLLRLDCLREAAWVGAGGRISHPAFEPKPTFAPPDSELYKLQMRVVVDVKSRATPTP